MARIVVGSYMVRYPMGGMLSWVLQYLVGFDRLGHEVYFVERAHWADACFDPVCKTMSDDPSTGIALTSALLERFGLGDRWCFVDIAGQYHGMSEPEIRSVLDTADLFIDMGVHGSWSEDAAGATRSMLIDGDPGFTQMHMVQREGTSNELPPFDYYYSTGRNVGTSESTVPVAGKQWRPIFHPVVVDLFPFTPPAADAPATTVMNWQSYEPVEFEGRLYGHKDMEFGRFLDLPSRCATALEVAVAGHDVPRDELRANGWGVRDGLEVTRSFDVFREYIRASCAEFTVCKNAYVATNSGWFSDRSAAYLASGRPVVSQETGFSDHLPTGAGLFAVGDVTEAAAAFAEIEGDPAKHAASAREVAGDCLEARIVLGQLLHEVGL